MDCQSGLTLYSNGTVVVCSPAASEHTVGAGSIGAKISDAHRRTGLGCSVGFLKRGVLEVVPLFFVFCLSSPFLLSCLPLFLSSFLYPPLSGTMGADIAR